MAEFLGSPLVQYFETGTSEFLTGGKLYSYEAGTLVAKATYPTIADALASTNPNTNPTILDSRGEASIVIQGATKVILKDSNDVTYWTSDDLGTTTTTITDSNGNELLKFIETASAVNEFTITNAATGGSPKLEASGDDINISTDILSKGSGDLNLDGGASGDVNINSTSTGGINLDGNTIITGTHRVTGTSTLQNTVNISSDSNLQMNGNDVLQPATTSQQGSIKLYEDTDNGTNYAEWQAPANITASYTLTIPTGVGTTGQVLTSDGAGNATWNNPDMVLLDTQTADASASLAFTSSMDGTQFTSYLILFSNLRPTVDGTGINFFISSDNGATYYNSANDYTHSSLIVNAAGTVAGSSSLNASVLPLVASNANSASKNFSGELRVLAPHLTLKTHMTYQFASFQIADNTVRSTQGVGATNISIAHNAFKIQCGTGNLVSGFVKLYGIA